MLDKLVILLTWLAVMALAAPGAAEVKGGSVLVRSDPEARVFLDRKMIHRGGSFMNDSIRCRAANRLWGVRTARFQHVGLRLVGTSR